MSNPTFNSVDDYLASQPPQNHRSLESVRSAIRSALPNAEELISYNIPAYKVNGKAVIYFAGWKKHYAIYPVSAVLLSAFANELSICKVAKSTLQFDYTKPVPSDLIRRIAEFRVAENSSRDVP